MSIEEAAAHIAEKNRGIFKFTAARRVMVSAGIVPEVNPGSTAVYRVMSESTRFRKGSMRGEYELIEETAVEPRPTTSGNTSAVAS